MRSVSTSDLARAVAGGALGCLARDAIDHLIAVPGGTSWPTATFVINLAGSLLAGLLFGILYGRFRPAVDTHRQRVLWTLLGVGVLGGFTTYSSLAVETTLLGRAGHWPIAVGYPIASVAAGVALAGAGVWVGRAIKAGR